jgi:hypothetical protein
VSKLEGIWGSLLPLSAATRYCSGGFFYFSSHLPLPPFEMRAIDQPHFHPCIRLVCTVRGLISPLRQRFYLSQVYPKRTRAAG